MDYQLVAVQSVVVLIIFIIFYFIQKAPKKCKTGQYFTNGSCIACEAGYACPTASQHLVCGPLETSEEGATSCVAKCNVPTQYMEGGQCKPCPAGKKCDGDSTTYPCPAGVTSDQGTGLCNKCKDTAEVFSSSYGVCTKCPSTSNLTSLNKYEIPNKFGCKCPAENKYENGVCSPCAAGEYYNDKNACVACPPNSSTTNTGPTLSATGDKCKCAAGKTASGDGTSCSP